LSGRPGASPAVLGGIALPGFYLLLVLVSPSGMGMGDVKAAASLGTMLAWRGWSARIAGGFAGFMFAGAFLVILAWHS
jgi:leader peptidase (prepilin peptidase)/N-methyltransferase